MSQRPRPSHPGTADRYPRRVSTPRAVLFDAGGTLVTIHPDRFGDIIEPVIGTRPDPGAMFDAHYRAMDAVVRNPAVVEQENWWQWWLGEFLGFTGLETSDDAAAALFGVTGLWQRPIPGVIEAVTEIKEAGIAIAVVSNADGHVAIDLEAAGYGHLFDIIIDSSIVGVSKPDPAIFTPALEALGVEPADAWYVGDSPIFDLGGATNAGLAEFVLVDPLGFYDHRPAVRSVAQLPELLSLPRL